jgi:DNA-binding IclR family transcriptional regulator
LSIEKGGIQLQTPADKKTLSSVTNTLKVLRLFSWKQPELSFTEIKEQLQLPKSSTHRYISALVDNGLLSKNPKTNHYRLGLSILSLGGAVFRHNELYMEALPIIEELSQEIDETVHICFMENNKVVYLFRVEGSEPDRLVTQIGRTNPVHSTSEGLSILAFQPESYINSFLKQNFTAYTKHTLTTPNEILTELKTIREQDYCLLDSAFFENYMSIAVPIRDYTEDVVASLSVIGQSARLMQKDIDYLVPTLKEAAEDISEHLGYY